MRSRLYNKGTKVWRLCAGGRPWWCVVGAALACARMTGQRWGKDRKRKVLLAKVRRVLLCAIVTLLFDTLVRFRSKTKYFVSQSNKGSSLHMLTGKRRAGKVAGIRTFAGLHLPVSWSGSHNSLFCGVSFYVEHLTRCMCGNCADLFIVCQLLQLTFLPLFEV